MRISCVNKVLIIIITLLICGRVLQNQAPKRQIALPLKMSLKRPSFSKYETKIQEISTNSALLNGTSFLCITLTTLCK